MRIRWSLLLSMLGCIECTMGLGWTGLMAGGKPGTVPVKIVEVLRDYSNR